MPDPDRQPSVAHVARPEDVDLTAVTGPIFTYVESVGELRVNTAAVRARSRRDPRHGDAPAPVLLGPLLFQPSEDWGRR